MLVGNDDALPHSWRVVVRLVYHPSIRKRHLQYTADEELKRVVVAEGTGLVRKLNREIHRWSMTWKAGPKACVDGSAVPFRPRSTGSLHTAGSDQT